MRMPSTDSYCTTRRNAGFTIVELLIVIVVIGILAAITVVAYNNVQDRARSAAIVSGIKKIEKALRLYAIDDNRSTWWIDNNASLTGVANPLISDIITSQAGFRSYLQSAPDVAGLSTGYWWYDNDNDIYDPAACTSATSGVNIVFTNVSQSVIQKVDDTLDDGNLACGKVRLNISGGNRLFYSLSDVQQIQ